MVSSEFVNSLVHHKVNNSILQKFCGIYLKLLRKDVD